jgi:hypothetical protein
MAEESVKKTEITLTKEIRNIYCENEPNFKVFSNRCPSKSSTIRTKWKDTFQELCPPLQPEMDLIIWEPPDPAVPNAEEMLRAIEIKYFRKINGKVNQSFYKGIEQSLALLQWGFDNVALWQLFDESFTDYELCLYGGRTWAYVHNRLDLPIDFTMLSVEDVTRTIHRFQIVQPDWDNFPKIRDKWNLSGFKVGWRKDNPFRKPPVEIAHHPLLRKFIEESNSLRTFLLDWLKRE